MKLVVCRDDSHAVVKNNLLHLQMSWNVSINVTNVFAKALPW